MTTNQIAQLSDDALIDATALAACTERRATADLLRLLMEVNSRKLYLPRGYSSMFAFCTRALRFSEQAAYSRITAARAARRFPRLLNALSTGDLTLSGVGLLAPHLTDENAEALIEDASGRSTREVERMIAALHAQPDIPASVRALPVAEHRSTDARTASGLFGGEVSTNSREQRVDLKPIAATNTPPATRPILAPISPKRYLLKITVTEDTYLKLERLRALLRHSLPDGNPGAILDRALTVLLEQTERQKAAAVSRPRFGGAKPMDRRTIPAAVRRTVWRRDAGRCAFRGTDGRCGETSFIEFHHVVPFAAGGLATVDNIELRCRAHNAHEATLFFGTNDYRMSGARR